MNKTCLLVAALVGGALAGADDKVVGGPYVVNTGPHSATVAWVVESRVGLGTAPGKRDRQVPALRSEKVVFNGLEPGKTYHYDVDGTEAGKGSFQTAPVGEVSFEFVVMGDTRTRHDVHRSVVAAALKQGQPAFVLHTGDQVADGLDPAQWPIFFDIERELLQKVTFFPSLGNHERNTPYWYDFFAAERSYYSFDWGTSHFAVLNTDINNMAPTAEGRERFWEAETKWLRDDLEKSQNAEFRFVMGHHPPMTAVSNRQGDNPHMAALMSMLTQFKVAAGFFGHDHNYQHYLKDGVRYFVTGGGGAPLYDVNRPPENITQKVARTENFMVVKIGRKSARFEAYSPDGQLIDSSEAK